MIEMGGGLFFFLLFFGQVALPSPCWFSLIMIEPIVTNPPSPPRETARLRAASFLVTKREAMADLESDKLFFRFKSNLPQGESYPHVKSMLDQSEQCLDSSQSCRANLKDFLGSKYQ